MQAGLHHAGGTVHTSVCLPELQTHVLEVAHRCYGNGSVCRSCQDLVAIPDLGLQARHHGTRYLPQVCKG